MNKLVEEKMATYPPLVKQKLEAIRDCILAVARQEKLAVTETLKWNEPSYVVDEGSTVRFDWKSKTPEQYAVFFNCKTKLVETFKELYPHEFIFEGNRAIIFPMNASINFSALKHCISLSFRYHKIKHLPLLGT